MATADRGELWKQYETLKDLYKFYVAQLVDFHRFYFGIAGALAVYVLAAGRPVTALALLLPLVISTGGVVTFIFGIRKSRELTEEIKSLAKRLDMLAAHTEVLEFLCWAFLLVHLLMVAGLAWLLAQFLPVDLALGVAPAAGGAAGG